MACSASRPDDACTTLEIVAPERFAVDPGMRVLIADLHLSWPRVLRRAGLPADLLARGAATLTVDEYFGLWSALEDEGGERDLAVEIGQAISVETFSPPIVAALCSPTLTGAARRIATYKPLIGPLALHVDETSAGLRIKYAWPAHQRPPTLLSTSEAVFWVALARIGTRTHVQAAEVSLRAVPRDAAGLERFLGCSLRRSTVDSITFTAHDAVRPFLTENEAMWRFFSPELRRRLSDLHADATVAERVCAALRETLPAGQSSITAVTKKLGVSSRTLQRQLHDEGTTYQAVLSSTRAELAREYLGRGSLRTSEIAYLLGYDDSNSFYRAFRTWTGTTPEGFKSAVAS
jgi:AraC-like DNA-binding protein